MSGTVIPSPPTGALETTSTRVSLFFVGGNDSYYVDFSENTSFPLGYYTRALHGQDKLHLYTFLSPTPGTKTVYARFITSSLGTPSNVFSDSIVLKSPAQPTSEVQPHYTTSTTSTVSTSSPQASSVQVPPDQINDVRRPQIETLPQGFRFLSPLFLGLKNDDVRYLQSFLSQYPDIYPEGLITGYFGPLTKAAVQRFQCKHNILCDENDSAYGYVGPKTRAKINALLREPLTPVPEQKLGTGQASDNLPLTSSPPSPQAPAPIAPTAQASPLEIKLIQEKLNDLQQQLTIILNQLVERLKASY